jgi:hypothetical protein
MQRAQTGLQVVASALCLGLFAAHASAQDLSACGQNMYIKADANCELVKPVECEAMCTPVTIEAACAAELTAKCDGQCKAEAEVSCTGSCDASCETKCQVDPGKFDCSASCQASCAGDCDARCAGGKGGAHCAASCKASCSGTCNAKCDVKLPEADCKAKCQASCSGSCKAKANADCQISCQADFDAKCDFDVEGGCKAECKKNPEGGLFCDGQIVKSASIDECADAIKGLLNGSIEGYAEGSAMCADGTCTSGGEAGASCSALSGKDAASGAFSALLVLGLASVLRRQREKQR